MATVFAFISLQRQASGAKSIEISTKISLSRTSQPQRKGVYICNISKWPILDYIISYKTWLENGSRNSKAVWLCVILSCFKSLKSYLVLNASWRFHIGTTDKCYEFYCDLILHTASHDMTSCFVYHDDVIKTETLSALLALCAGNSPVTGHTNVWPVMSEVCGPFYWYELNIIPAWIRHPIPSNVWDEIFNPSLNFISCTGNS